MMRLPAYLSLLNRRRWLKVALLGTVSRRFLNAGETATPSIQPIAAHLTPSDIHSAIIPIRVSDYPELAVSGGSVAIYFSELLYPIVINRGDNDAFYALDPTCTHQGCQVGNYNSFVMPCDCHGSQYNIEGKVVMGPAQFDLSSYPSQFDGDDLLEIELTGVPLRIDQVTLHSRTAGVTRLKLEFPGTSGCKYQVKYHADLFATPQIAMFSLTASGAANHPSFTVPEYTHSDPVSGDGPKSLWVDAPGSTGFFTVEMVLGTELPL
ncbi:MAG TPA: ubiquinol-cytochrome c reductase iron-sulfur subunit [Verrucomicrobiaceae bacterium]